MIKKIKKELLEKSRPEKAEILQRFFKTGEGQYGEGDIFIGVTMPEIREIVKRNLDVGLSEVNELLDSGIHEERMAGLLILVYKFNRGEEDERNEIYNFYLGNTLAINNWDLVDVTCSQIVGGHLVSRKRDILYRLSKSENMWERRIAIVTCLAFVKRGELDDALALSEILLGDEHDLMHKAVGWVLREVGKKDGERLREFLRKHYGELSRTTLRYSIERFPQEERKGWLAGAVD